MKILIALLITLPVFAAKIDAGPTVKVKWITVDFEKAQQVTLKGKLKVEKDCNDVFLQNQQLSLVSHDRYFLSVDQWSTTKGCPDNKKTNVELDMQTFTLMNEKRNSVQILVPDGASFTIQK
jgi:hypothetical protein